MFYIYEGKIYSAVLDEKSGVYPQVVLVRQENGYSVARKGMGLKQRPRGCPKLTVTEVLARSSEEEAGEEE